VAGEKHDKSNAAGRRFDGRLAVVFVVLAFVGVGIVSRYALLTVLLDGLAAAIVVLPPALAGLWLVPLFRTGPLPLRWHLLLGAVLGLGATALLVLLLGLAGVLNRPVWVGIISLLAVAGFARAAILLNTASHRETAEVDPPRRRPGAVRYLWLLAAPFFSLALLASSNAPGFIWQEEGYGYDVLEYHLQMPKEYFHAGRIEYAPHNGYANFPANVEMLYLLAMILLDDDIDVGTTANMIHLILGLLAVYAAWVIGREWSPRAGILAAVMMATAGWLCYLCGLAYVEHGMLFFGTAATAALLCVVRAAAEGGEDSHGIRNRTRCLSWAALAGVAAGFACGCKYTAIPMIALPLGLITILLPAVRLRRRLVAGLVFAAATALTFSPWLIKNLAMTGNPVFPLANKLFQAAPPGWSEESTARWDYGHTPGEPEQTASARVGALWRYVPGDHLQRFGPAVFLLALGGLFGRRRDRTDWCLVVILLIQLGVWLFATHLYARFAVVLLIPLALLAGRALLEERGARLRIIVGLTVVGGAWNFAFAAKLHEDESPGGAPGALVYKGQLRGYEYFEAVNGQLPQDAKLLLVGDARAFYFQRRADYWVVFNRNPFIEAIREASSDREIVGWLQGRGYTHLLVGWSEIGRLRESRYGFPAEVNARLFERLTDHGLALVREFEHPEGRNRGRYVTLYRVPGL
jgi:hypothetical protein